MEVVFHCPVQCGLCPVVSVCASPQFTLRFVQIVRRPDGFEPPTLPLGDVATGCTASGTSTTVLALQDQIHVIFTKNQVLLIH